MRKRVVITGMGAVTSLGIGAENLWKSIKEGKSGISRIERVDVSDLPVKVGAEIKNFDPSNFMDKKEVRRTDRFAQFALAAAQMAIENSKLDLESINKERVGVIIGTGVGGIENYARST
ncbi:3-oxoacyl-(acyl-carrier-protein) synthase [Clostridium saccharobutylicum]|nr:3-oxoacyl-(acyl-carrier-protein) synthase [Clostridium saccharobutylicum]